MRLDSYARCALLGALVVSLACARNTEDGDNTSATGRVTTADTGAGPEVVGDTVRPSVTDSAPTGLEPTDPTSVDTSAATGWPVDTMQGWSTPPDSGR